MAGRPRCPLACRRTTPVSPLLSSAVSPLRRSQSSLLSGGHWSPDLGPYPGGFHCPLIIFARTPFQTGSRSQVTHLCGGSLRAPGAGSRPTLEPCLQSAAASASAHSLKLWASGTGLRVCAGPAERPGSFRVSWAPSLGPVQLPLCARSGEGRTPPPNPFISRLRIPHGPSHGSFASWVTVKVNLRPACEPLASNPTYQLKTMEFIFHRGRVCHQPGKPVERGKGSVWLQRGRPTPIPVWGLSGGPLGPWTPPPSTHPPLMGACHCLAEGRVPSSLGHAVAAVGFARHPGWGPHATVLSLCVPAGQARTPGGAVTLGAVLCPLSGYLPASCGPSAAL